jgi:hypothetical protein
VSDGAESDQRLAALEADVQLKVASNVLEDLATVAVERTKNKEVLERFAKLTKFWSVAAGDALKRRAEATNVIAGDRLKMN